MKNLVAKTQMMIHRKREHPNMVKYCTKINTNECKFGENECWFKHSGENVQEESLENKIKDMINQKNLVFTMFAKQLKEKS